MSTLNLGFGLLGQEVRKVYKTVKWTLLSLGLEEFTHVCIRRHSVQCGYEMLGGGSVSSVLSRFGNLMISDSFIRDDVLYIFVV